MSAAAVDIANDALVIVGASTISSLSDSSKEAIVMNSIYTKVRDQLLASHPWNFAMDRKSNVAADVSLPTGNWGWAYAFTLPAEVLRIWEIDDSEESWSVESGILLTQYSPVSYRYIKRQTDTTKYSPYFERAFAYALALRSGFSLTQSATLIEQLQKLAASSLAEARSYDAQENSLQQVEATDFLDIRR